MRKRIGIIGFGKIGKHLYQQARQMGWNVVFVFTSKYVYFDGRGEISEQPKDSLVNWQKYCENVDVVFLAIPTSDSGFTAQKYISFLAKRNIPIITCEKGALANYFSRLKLLLPKIGYGATVGGGSGMIYFLQQRFFSGMQEVHAILNGTLNYIFTDLAMGNPLGHIIEEVKMLGYAEPGKNNPIQLILNEACLDATKKAAILFNLCFGSPVPLRARDIAVILDEEMVKDAIVQAADRRFVVSFYKADIFRPDTNNIPAFCHVIDRWVIKGGFVRMDNPLIARLCHATPWVNNGILTVEGNAGADGVYVSAGPGAGASPTTAAMIRDAERLLI